MQARPIYSDHTRLNRTNQDVVLTRRLVRTYYAIVHINNKVWIRSDQIRLGYIIEEKSTSSIPYAFRLQKLRSYIVIQNFKLKFPPFNWQKNCHEVWIKKRPL